MATNVEVARHLVDKHKPAKLASFLCSKSLYRILINFFILCETLGALTKFVCHGFFRINLSVSFVVNVLNDSNIFAELVEPMLLQLTLNINNMHSSYINNIQT